MNKRYFVLYITLVFVITFFCGCSLQKSQPSSDNKDTDERTIQIAYVDWSEDVAMSNLVKYVLEEKMNYTVVLKKYDVAGAFSNIADGEEDVFMDAWLPSTHEYYMKKYDENIEDIGINFNGTKIGLVVPTYVGINSINNINLISDEVDNKIVGINAQAGIMKKTNTAIQEYNLNIKLQEGSEAEMIQQLQLAIDKKKPIIITGWSPHWMFAKWDLKFLDDPSIVYGKTEEVHTLARKDFSKDMPKVAQVLANFYLDGEELDSLMEDIENRDSHISIAQVCKTWAENHKDLIDSWISE